VLFASGSQNRARAQTAPPPGYVLVPGSPDLPLNPSHVGAVGSEFSQDCNDANPDPPGPGEVGWHFVLPQSVAEELSVGGNPGNIFASLTVTFETAGTVTLTVFGPPTAAHAYVTTPTDDTLLSGSADIYRLISLLRQNEPFFNLSHTCAPAQTTTTTTTTTTSTTTSTTTLAPTTSSSTTTTTSAATTTVDPGNTTTTLRGGAAVVTTTTTLDSGNTTTTLRGGAAVVTTTTTLDSGNTTTTLSGGGAVVPTSTISGGSGGLAPTGSGSTAPVFAAIAVAGGIGLILLTRREPKER
jgi:hypothetical protein